MSAPDACNSEDDWDDWLSVKSATGAAGVVAVVPFDLKEVALPTLTGPDVVKVVMEEAEPVGASVALV